MSALFFSAKDLISSGAKALVSATLKKIQYAILNAMKVV